MPNAQLTAYIAQQLKAGVTRDMIEKTLSAQGWGLGDITAAFPGAPGNATQMVPGVPASATNPKKKGVLVPALIAVIVILLAIIILVPMFILTSLHGARTQAQSAIEREKAMQARVDAELRAAGVIPTATTTQ